MNYKEKYLFDLQGFIVVKNVLSAEHLKRMNNAIDAKTAAGQDVHMGFLGWEEPAFRDLIDDPAIEPYLAEILGEEYRLDHEYSIIHQRGAKHLGLHGGGNPFLPGEHYVFGHEKMHSGLTVVSYALTDIGPDDGGFCCIPGSHKANYKTPMEYGTFAEIGPIVHIPQEAGDVLIFTEALTHGTFAWQADHERRSLLYKYSPCMMSWWAFERTPELMSLLTDKQRSVITNASALYYRKRSRASE